MQNVDKVKKNSIYKQILLYILFLTFTIKVLIAFVCKSKNRASVVTVQKQPEAQCVIYSSLGGWIVNKLNIIAVLFLNIRYLCPHSNINKEKIQIFSFKINQCPSIIYSLYTALIFLREKIIQFNMATVVNPSEMDFTHLG